MRHRIVVNLILVILCLFPAAVVLGDNQLVDGAGSNGQNSALAEETLAQADTAGTSLTETVLPSFTRIGISLAIIIGVIYASVFVLRKLSGQRIGRRGQRTIQVVEQAYLAPKKSICLLKLADRAVLVGITESNINLLTEMPWDELPEDFLHKTNDKTGGFQSILGETVGKFLGQRRSRGSDHE